MKEYKIYGICLELHDHHTLWDIEKPIDKEEYNFIVQYAIDILEKRYKSLTVYCEGRSGRHICIDDTPTNRRRFKCVQAYAKKLEKAVIRYCNDGGLQHAPIDEYIF